jgi:hypothetical protein
MSRIVGHIAAASTAYNRMRTTATTCVLAVSLLRFMQARASALTLSFTLAMVLLGCMAPLVALGFITQTHSLASPALLMILSAAVSGGTVLALELRQVD